MEKEVIWLFEKMDQENRPCDLPSPRSTDFRLPVFRLGRLSLKKDFWGGHGYETASEIFDVRLGFDVYAGLVYNQGE
ncbi:MAG: hypothetical protein PHS89_02095 [Syntrophaceticus schinkii]|nr:hypothetical protein [Syntrophaceticus schinkii]MDD4260964.1 hypothetical protein [Syntrophaceticus schinkii]MDD4674059.1 hypothetical protein [Syntrophaceticus schinkii]